MRGVKKVVSSKSGMKIESCYSDYLWVGVDGDHRVLVVDTDARLARLRDEIDRILAKRRMKRLKRKKHSAHAEQASNQESK